MHRMKEEEPHVKNKKRKKQPGFLKLENAQLPAFGGGIRRYMDGHKKGMGRGV